MIQVTRFGLPLAAAATLFLASEVHATPLPSSLFNHKYEGDTFSPSDYTTVEPPGGGSWWTDGDILTIQNTVAATGAFFQTNWGSLPENPVNNALGWTIEFSVKIGTDAEAGANGAFNLLAKDVAGTNSQGRRVGLGILPDSVVLPGALGTGSGSPLTIYTGSNTDSFHVFRVAQDPSSSHTRIWRDGVLIFNDLSRQANDPSSGGSSQQRMFWGDGSAAAGGPTVELDYLRWDSTGTYEPVVSQPGDFDGDGDVDGADFVAWQTNFPKAENAAVTDGDADGDGDVDGADFSAWQSAFPLSQTAVTAVPEPASALLAVIGGMIAWRLRKLAACPSY